MSNKENLNFAIDNIHRLKSFVGGLVALSDILEKSVSIENMLEQLESDKVKLSSECDALKIEKETMESFIADAKAQADALINSAQASVAELNAKNELSFAQAKAQAEQDIRDLKRGLSDVRKLISEENEKLNLVKLDITSENQKLENIKAEINKIKASI